VPGAIACEAVEWLAFLVPFWFSVVSLGCFQCAFAWDQGVIAA